MDTTTVILIALAVAIVAGAAWAVSRRQRRTRLREGYGPDYDRAVERLGSPDRADEDLLRRERMAKKLEAKPLSPIDRDRFAQRWRAVQTDFVERPEQAIVEAEKLVSEVLRARGYPVDDELQRHADLRVGHPEVLEEYRSARHIVERDGENGTEDLRQAMVHYRNIFGTLIGEEGRRAGR